MSEHSPEREIVIRGDPWRVYEAWRAPSGLGLAYFVREGGEPGEDRRADLGAEDALIELDDAALHELFDRAVGVTPSERRFFDDGDRVWLVQGVGPTWAEGGSAAAAVGIRLRCISERRPIIELRGRAPAELSDNDLREALGAMDPKADSEESAETAGRVS